MKELIGLVVLLTHACFPQTMLLLLASQWDFVDTNKTYRIFTTLSFRDIKQRQNVFFPFKFRHLSAWKGAYFWIGSAFSLHFLQSAWRLRLLGNGGYLYGDVIPLGLDSHSSPAQTDTGHTDPHTHTHSEGSLLSGVLSLTLLLSLGSCCHSLIAVLRGASMIAPDEA